MADEESLAKSEVTGTIAKLKSAVVEGNTRVYVQLEGDDFYYVLSVADTELAAVLEEGDEVTLAVAEGEGELRSAYSVVYAG